MLWTLPDVFRHTVRRNSSLVFSQRLLRFIWVWNIDNPVMYPADVSGCYCDVVVATVISARRAHPVEKCLTGKTSIMVDWEIVFGSYIGEQHSLQCKLYMLSELSSLKRTRTWTHCLIRTSFVCFNQEMFVVKKVFFSPHDCLLLFTSAPPEFISFITTADDNVLTLWFACCTGLIA